MKVAVIGAGASGITALKCCLDEGLEPVCYELTDDIGGLWRYTDTVTEGQACVMKSTVINTSKETMCYSDFPIPEEFPIYMHNTYVQKYFNLYVDKFGLRKYIQFRHKIISVKQADDFENTGKWMVKVKDLERDQVHDLIYDAIMICTGHHAEKNMPNFPGLENFKGKYLHSHDYRHPQGYEGKRIMVVGIGNSGGDAAVELSRIGSKTFLSTRSGSWVYNRISEKGIPIDMVGLRRIFVAMKNFLGPQLSEKMTQAQLNKRFDHSMYRLKPKHGVFAQHPTINDDLPNRIASGTLIVKPNIKHFTEHGVVFDDGTKEENIDVVIFATGYIFGFPFLDPSVLKVDNNRVDLFKYVFPPNISIHTLSVIGCIQPLGSLMPISELQSRLATRVFKGEVTLPSKAEMWQDIRNRADQMRKRYTDASRHTIQVEWIDYMDQLATLNKCRPDIRKMFIRDPKLAWSCYFGPCTPYQYRLEGPGKWDGARDAILTSWNRMLFPLKTRPLGFEENDNGFSKFYILLMVILAIILYKIFM